MLGGERGSRACRARRLHRDCRAVGREERRRQAEEDV